MNKPRQATFYTAHKKGGFSLDFQVFSEFDNTGYKTGRFLDLTELHNKKVRNLTFLLARVNVPI